MTATASAQQGFLNRFVQYFVTRKNKFLVLGAVCFVLWVAQKRGYLKRLLSYSLEKAEERIKASIEKSNKEMMLQAARTEDFSNSLKLFYEKYPSLAMSYLSRHLDSQYGLDQIKEGLKNKSLDQAEKTKKWIQFREAVTRSVVVILLAKSYLWSVWLIRDILQVKIKNSLDELVKTTSAKDTKFLSDSIGATQDFINLFVDGVVNHAMAVFSETAAKLGSNLEFKLTEKLSIDTLITKLEDVKSALLEVEEHSEAEKPDQFELNIRRLGVAKNNLRFNLVHKRAYKSAFSIKKSVSTFFSLIFKPASGKLQTEFEQTVFSKRAFGCFKNYSVDLKGYSLVGYFLAETRRKSADRLSTIAEVQEGLEDRSSDAQDEMKAIQANELVYEESSTIEGKNYEKQQYIIFCLEKLVHSTIKEFLDHLTSANCQLLTETALEYNFKKFATRLELFKAVSAENKGDVVYLKLLTALNKILEEEMINKQAAKNDCALYEARTKELFKIAKKTEVENPEAALVNILVAQEAKGHAMIQRSTREWAARIFFEEEFDQYYGDEFEVTDDQKQSPAKDEQQQLIQMLSKLKQPEAGQVPNGPLESLLQF